MSFALNQLKYALGFGGMMSFYGVASLHVFFVPITGVGQNHRIVVIGLLLLTLPFALFGMFMLSRRGKKKAKLEAEAAGKAAETAPVEGQAQKLATPAGNYSDLQGGTEEAVQFLKTSNLSGNGKDAIYSLPWYLVAGAPKSGKSSLVMSSNLNFQTLPSQRQSEQKFIRPTGNIDWRVTSDAVFVDTAGRYQTEGADADEWASMLETIRKYRGNRPIDGFILTVNAEQVLKSDERQLEELAKVLRARLDETMQRLKVRFPVYIVFTHADTIEGFRDSFSSSKNEDKTFVWGSTIPIEKSDNAQAQFDAEYEILHNSLMKRRLARLSAPFPPVRQLRIFNFPLHFGSARRKFGTFINSLFRPNPFSENPFLRGFYFTAAPVARSAGNAPPQVGNSYFTERFFKDVVLRDKDLVKTFIAQRQRPPIFGWFVTLLTLFITFCLLVMASVSLYSNSQMLAEAEKKGGDVLTIVKTDAANKATVKTETQVRQEIAATENLRELLGRLDDYERNGAPVYMRFGLYSGNQLYKRNLLPMYMAVVEQRFKTPTVKKIEADLKKFAAGNPVVNSAKPTEEEEKVLGKHYDLLKAYLMLTGDHKDNAEPGHLVATLKDYWTTESKIPADMKLTAQQQLEFWAKQVDRDDDDYKFPRISKDVKLVDDTRTKLQAFPAPYRYLSRKVTEISKEIDDKVGSTTTESILTRNGADTGFLAGSYSVPSAYTRPGYELMKTAIAEANEKLSEDDWVMGEIGKKQVAQTTDASMIEDRYFRDYEDHWRNFVKAVNVKPYKNKTEATNALQAFSSANSPMKILVREIAKNTNLSAKPEVEEWWPWLKSFFSKAKDSETGGTLPEKAFRPLFTFIGTKDQAANAPVEKYQNEIGKMFKDFNGLSEDKIKSIALEMQKDEDPIKLRARETAVTNLLQGFSETPSSQELAALMQEPLANLRNFLGGGAKEQIVKIWNDQIMPAAKEIEKGYPFEDGQSESDLTKFSAFLAPGEGKFSKFYDDKLSKYFEEAGSQLKVKEDSEIKFTDEFVAYLNNAFALRKALFGTNPEPKFEYEFTLRPVKDAMVEVTIDGQKTTSEGTGSLKGTFPGGSSAETGVLINLASTSGTSATSAAPSANSPAANVSTSGTPQTDTAAQPLKYPGTWGLFRFVDAGGAAKQPTGEYLLNYTVGGKSVAATIKTSGGDLFDKNIFKQVKAPANFLK